MTDTLRKTDILRQELRKFAGFLVQFRFAKTALPVAMVLFFAGFATLSEARDPNSPAANRAIGLAPIADWSPAQPFLDVMKTARPWIGHKPGQWGGVNADELAERGVLDDQGWPTQIPSDLASIGTVLLTDLPIRARSLAGRYRVTFAGNGIVELSGRAQNVRYNAGGAAFDFTPGPGPVVLKINRSDPADPVRDIQVVNERYTKTYDAGQMFNPDWIEQIGQFGTVRFMDWMETNNSSIQSWADQPQAGDYTYMGQGVPMALMVRLANEQDFNVWFTLPHRANDDYFRRYAEYVRDHLRPDLRVTVEYSNEMWNYVFEQTRWADVEAKALWGADHAGLQFYRMRSQRMAEIWREVFAGQEDRLITVISTQTGWLGREDAVFNAPLWPDKPPTPLAAVFDAYAITGYFSARLGHEEKVGLVRGWLEESRIAAETAAAGQGLTGDAYADYVRDHRFDHAVPRAIEEIRTGSLSGDTRYALTDLLTRLVPHHRAVADRHGLDLIMYEGGTHVVGIGAVQNDAEIEAFFLHLNYTEEMGGLYQELLDGWAEAGGQLFNAYAGVFKPGRWGSWGHLRYLEDDNARWRALIETP